MSVLSLQANTQSGLDRVEVGGQLAAERAVALLESHRLDRVVAGVDEAEVGAGRHQRVVHAERDRPCGTYSSQPSSPT